MNTSKRKNVLATMVGLFATAGGVGSALGQGDEAATAQGRIDEIIVTANKREQRLIDVPISIATLSGQELEEAGVQNVADLSYAVPNLSVLEKGPGFQTITLRGMGNESGSSSLIGLYLDEVPMTNLPNLQPDIQTIDLQRVEVLRGPQGTLYGQGSVGGTIRFITNNPTFDGVEGNVGLSFSHTDKGGWNEELTAVLNLPVIEDELAFRVATTFKDKDGWIDQPAAGRKDINDNELSHIRIKGLWHASDRFTINTMAVRHRNNAGHDNLVNTATVSESEYLAAVDPTLSNMINDDYDVYNLTINYDFEFAELTSASSYIDINSVRELDSRFAIVPGVTAGSTVTVESLIRANLFETEIFSQEIRLGSKANESELDWTLGVFYLDTDLLQEIGSFDLAIGGTFIGSFPFLPINQHSESIAYFGDVSYDISDRLNIGLGVRYFEDDREYREGATSLAETFDQISSKIYLTYVLNSSSNLYMSVSEGFRSGGFNPLSAANATYEPETLISYEAGIKAALLDNKLQAEFAIFYSQYTDFQTPFSDPLTGEFYTSNPGEAEVNGVELNVKWAITDQFSLGLNGNVTDAEVVKINSVPSSMIKGDPLIFVPDYNYSINANYMFDWDDDVGGFVRVAYNRQGENNFVNRTAGLAQAAFQADSIGLLDAQVGAKFGSLEIELFGKNLLDEDGITTASPIGIAPQERPRTIGLNARYDF